MDQVRIQSDGTPRDTVITLADGRVLEKVRAVSIRMDAGDAVNECDIEVWMPQVDVHATVRSVTFTCQVCSDSLSHDCTGNTLGGP